MIRDEAPRRPDEEFHAAYQAELVRGFFRVSKGLHLLVLNEIEQGGAIPLLESESSKPNTDALELPTHLAEFMQSIYPHFPIAVPKVQIGQNFGWLYTAMAEPTPGWNSVPTRNGTVFVPDSSEYPEIADHVHFNFKDRTAGLYKVKPGLESPIIIGSHPNIIAGDDVFRLSSDVLADFIDLPQRMARQPGRYVGIYPIHPLMRT